ncbi:hypothetical protein [Caldimonas sp. KR1-144]|uniref:hypothetical protein n=1 Tax=Caldimonas sp. KR1-144 TaxID=3400911 RepID=UPI003C1172DF
MTNIQIELWQLITLLITLLLAFFGAVAAAGKMLLDQTGRSLDERFTKLQDQLDEIQEANREEAKQWKRVERELMELKAELPQRFVMREDYVRGQSVVEAKLDGLAVRIENLQLRTAARGD